MSMTIWLILSDLIWIACKLATTRAWHEQLGQKVTRLPEVPEFVWTCTILHNVAQSYPSTAPRKIDEQSCAKSQPHKNWCSQVSRDISSTEPAHQHHSSVTSHRVDSSPVQISPQGSEWWSLWLDIVLGFEVSGPGATGAMGSHRELLGTSGNPAAAESLAMYCSNFSHNLIELWGCLLKNAKVCIGQDCFPCQSHNRKLNVHSIPWEIQHTGSYGNSQFTR